MKIELGSLSTAIKPIEQFVRRFHTILFFMLISIGLFAAITVLLSIISLSSSTADTTTEPINGTFDEETINRVEQLDNQSASQPGSRPSPFVE